LANRTRDAFLIDRGYSPEAVGAFYTATIVAMLVGSLAGGFSADRIGHKRAVALFLVFVAAAITATTVADATNTNSLVVPLLVAIYLGIGLFTAASYALFMDLTDPKLGATQFSAFMGATNGCEAWAGFTVGRLVAASGYPFAFMVMAGLSLLALPLLATIDGREATGSQGSVTAVKDGNSPQ
jgi:MFS family permease